jgi:hypothetical protein
MNFQMNGSPMQRAALAASLVSSRDRAEDAKSAAGSSDIIVLQSPTDLAKCTTFAVPELDFGPARLPREVGTSLLSAVGAAKLELLARGFIEVTEAPDLHLFALGATQDEASIRWDCVGGWWLDDGGWQWDPCLWFADGDIAYPTGTLIVGLADASLCELVFGCAGPSMVASSEDVAARARRGVAQMFASVPRARAAELAIERSRSPSQRIEFQPGAIHEESSHHHGDRAGGALRGHLPLSDERRCGFGRPPLGGDIFA